MTPQSPPISFVNKDKDTQNLNGRKLAIPPQDVINEMMPKAVEANPPSPPGINYSALLAKSRVLPTDEIEADPVCLAIQTEDKTSIVGTLGNISTVSGRAKAKKTFVVSFAVAAAVGVQVILNKIKGLLPEDKNTVLLFDTEQSKHHVLKIVKRICRLCGIDDPSNLHVYSLRPYSPEDRLKIIDYALNSIPNVGLVVIDGIRDLAVDPVLDSEQASHIMTHLLQWTDRLHIHIMCVLHQNKSDPNLRGHLGTELTNKSETVISVTRDKNVKEVSHVEAEYCRNREFDPFSFYIDDNGIPHLVDEELIKRKPEGKLGNSMQATKKQELPTADSMTSEIVTTIISRAFSQDEYLGYSQLRTALIEASEFAGFSLSKNRAEVFIKRVIEQHQVTKFRPENSKYDAYRLPTNTVPNQQS
ncbi:AAA family ATPase [Spirosoma sp. KNUC1025]|uniref:AAA family ATPase n=1 Tax=Spirosoma sp. KNUC1025 TaxID=2894082 RepID=UPI0038677AED|nr:AAA family ATPase [Spirosoma sp. KNUC1025]